MEDYYSDMTMGSYQCKFKSINKSNYTATLVGKFLYTVHCLFHSGSETRSYFWAVHLGKYLIQDSTGNFTIIRISVLKTLKFPPEICKYGE